MELRKTLTTLGIFSLGTGAMISSGLFILPAVAFTEAGKWALLSYLLAGVCMLPALFTKLELASAIPKAGGAFFYLSRIFGAPVGMIAGFADWFSIALKSAFALVGIGVFGSLVFPGFGETEFKLIAIGACVLFTVINLVSVEGTGKFQVLMVAFLLSIMIAYVLVGYRSMDFAHFTGGRGFGLVDVVTTTGMVFISYGGITKIATAVEEVKDPKKMLVPGIMSAFLVVQVIYLLVVFVTIGAMRGPELSASFSPLTDAAYAFFSNHTAGVIARIVIAAAGLLAFFTTANAGILTASRVPMAMSRDGLLPTPIGSISKKGTPVPAIIATSAFMITIIAGLDITGLAKVASLFLMLVFFLENLGLIIIRHSRVATYRPIFRSPLFPVMQIFGIVVYGVLIVSQGATALLIAGGFVVLALGWYLVYARKGWSKTSAFIALVRRLSGPELATSETDLDEELLSILMERDDIRPDRFDDIVKNASIIDYDQTVTRETVFSDVARLFAERHDLEPEKLRGKFTEREESNPTLVYPGIAVPHAIPHVVIEGRSLFDMVLVRSKYGITWWGDKDVVYTAFCLIGSKDQRDFHLRALMSIAQILQDPNFVRSWHKASTERELRLAVILSHRKRFPEPVETSELVDDKEEPDE